MSKGEELLANYEEEVEATWRKMSPMSRDLCEQVDKHLFAKTYTARKVRQSIAERRAAR